MLNQHIKLIYYYLLLFIIVCVVDPQMCFPQLSLWTQRHLSHLHHCSHNTFMTVLIQRHHTTLCRLVVDLQNPTTGPCTKVLLSTILLVSWLSTQQGLESQVLG